MRSTAFIPTPACMRSRETPQKDELIRQVTINCAERGLLLLRVRDEIHMTIAAYQTMYESSIAFGIRKALIAEQRKAEMEAKVKTENICTTVSLGVVHGAFDEFLFLLLSWCKPTQSHLLPWPCCSGDACCCEATMEEEHTVPYRRMAREILARVHL